MSQHAWPEQTASPLKPPNGPRYSKGKVSIVITLPENWIGRSEGAELRFPVLGPEGGDSDIHIDVFTTRPDTIFGATYMVLSPEHPWVDELTTDAQRDAVEKYKAEDYVARIRRLMEPKRQDRLSA